MSSAITRDTPLDERIRAHSRPDENGCWLWQRHLDVAGYGRIAAMGRYGQLAHRVSYEAFISPIPAGLTVDHICFVRHCVNPDHLRLLTHGENVRMNQRWRDNVCKRGHEFTPENTLTRRNGSRRCRTCDTDIQRRAYLRRKAANS